METYLGIIAAFGFGFTPNYWMSCAGQILTINSNSALYALLGPTYGGNGTTTFALPDLRGRVIVGYGQGQGLSSYAMGQVGGSENITMNVQQMPIHAHNGTTTINAPVIADNSAANSSSPVGNRLAISPKTGSGPNASNLNIYTSAISNPVAIGSPTSATFDTSASGGNQPFPIMQPYLALNYCIAIQGIFPTRN